MEALVNKWLVILMALTFPATTLGAEPDSKIFGWFSDRPVIAEKPLLDETRAKAKSLPTKVRSASDSEARVIASIEARGYNTTYLELEADSKRFWIASSKLEVKTGNRVRFSTGKAVRLVNFTSKALNRTFRSIDFVSEVTVLDKSK